MKRSGAVWSWTILACAIGIAGAYAAPRVAPRISEDGFRVTHFDQCGYQGRVPGGPASLRPQRGTINDIECSRGGSWGSFAYLAIGTWNQDVDPIGLVERVSFSGDSSTFLSSGTHRRTVGLSFTPPDWRGGDLLLVATVPADFMEHSSMLVAYDATLAGRTIAYRIDGTVGSGAADPSGAFGFDLFYAASDGYVGDLIFVPGAIFRIDAAGDESAFADRRFGEMRFGPGGAWGSDLYVAGGTVAPDGSFTFFPAAFGEFDWASGPGFGGDMFAYITGEDPGTIFRVKPDGTMTVFAISANGVLAGCGNALWIANGEGCFVVESRGKR